MKIYNKYLNFRLVSGESKISLIQITRELEIFLFEKRKFRIRHEYEQ
jgi:hypothetical protein